MNAEDSLNELYQAITDKSYEACQAYKKGIKIVKPKGNNTILQEVLNSIYEDITKNKTKKIILVDGENLYNRLINTREIIIPICIAQL